MHKSPQEVLARWIECINHQEIDRIVDLYNDMSTFMPTFSPHRISKHREIKEYFLQLSKRPEMRAELHQETLKIVEIDAKKYILTGIYSFHFIVDDAKLTFPSRFTFILDISKEKPILHHHSSQIPRTLS